MVYCHIHQHTLITEIIRRMGCNSAKVVVESPVAIKQKNDHEDTLPILARDPSPDTPSMKKSASRYSTKSNVSRQSSAKERLLPSADAQPTSWRSARSPKFVEEDRIQSGAATATSISPQSSSHASDLNDSYSSVDTVKTTLRRDALDRFISARGRHHAADDVSVDTDESYPILDSLSSSTSDDEDEQCEASIDAHKSDYALTQRKTVASSPTPGLKQRLVRKRAMAKPVASC